MAVGQLTKFPIKTILEFATDTRKGIMPVLKSEVKMLEEASPSGVPSELAVRKAINQINSHAQFESVGIGMPIFSQMAGTQAQINSLIPSGADAIWLDTTTNTVMLSGWAVSSSTSATLDYIVFNEGDMCVNDSVIVIDPPLNGSSVITTYGMSVQGGKNQYCAEINYDELATSGVAIATAYRDDVIGKIFIKCEVPLEQNGSVYSVGDWTDKIKYTQNFSAPVNAGLVNFEYGDGMTSEFSWISAASADIVLWTYGTPPVTGKLGFSIFYDHVNWAPDFGYYLGTGATDVIRFDLTQEDNSFSYRAALAANTTSYGVFQNGYNMYAAGGIWTAVMATIQKYNSKNDTLAAVATSVLTVARMSTRGANSTLAGYVFGGQTASASSAVVDKLTFSTDTTNATSNATMNAARVGGGTVSNSTTAIVAGGFSYGVVPLSSIETMTFSSDTTMALSSSTLSENTYCMFSFDASSYGYLVGGQTGYSSFHKYNYSSGGVTTVSSSLVMPQYAGCDVQTVAYGYAIGGYSNGTPATFAQKIDMATDTVSVVNFECPQLKDAYGHSLGPATGCPGLSV